MAAGKRSFETLGLRKTSSTVFSRLTSTNQPSFTDRFDVHFRYIQCTDVVGWLSLVSLWKLFWTDKRSPGNFFNFVLWSLKVKSVIVLVHILVLYLHVQFCTFIEIRKCLNWFSFRHFSIESVDVDFVSLIFTDGQLYIDHYRASIFAFWYFAHVTFYFFPFQFYSYMQDIRHCTRSWYMVSFNGSCFEWTCCDWSCSMKLFWDDIRYLLMWLLTWLLVEKWSVWNWDRAFTCWRCVTWYILFLPCIVHFD